MRKLALLAGLSAAATACAGPMGAGGPRGLRPTANPSAVVATELAFARAAQEKGQWAAFREFAADEAVMFVPQQTAAKAWLKGRAEPPVAVKWQPYEVWMSCDGSLAVTKGAWQRPNGVGYFTTVWKRQNNGSYKWVLDQGDALKQPLPEPEMISAKVADCSKQVDTVTATSSIPEPVAQGEGQSTDWTLTYDWQISPSGERQFAVHMWNGHEMQEVMSTSVEAAAE
jgi:hypothetical protein